MTIKKLIKKLQKCGNQNASVYIVSGDYDYDFIDTKDFKIISKNCKKGRIELYIDEDDIQNPVRLGEC